MRSTPPSRRGAHPLRRAAQRLRPPRRVARLLVASSSSSSAPAAHSYVSAATHHLSATVACVGGGVAAHALAEAFASAGEGARLTLVCAEPSPPYDRTALSKSYFHSLAPAREGELSLRPREWYEANGVTLLVGVRATGVDYRRKALSLDTGQTLHYDFLIVATGSDAEPLPAANTRRTADLGTVAVRGRVELDRFSSILLGGVLTVRSMQDASVLVRFLD